MRFLIPLVLLSSCTLYHENDIKQTRTLAQVGGNVAWRKNVGLVAKNEKSFDRAMSVAETAATGYFAVKALKSTEATKQVEATEFTKQNAATQSASIEKASIEAKTTVTSQAIDKGAEVLPVSVNSP